MSTFEINHELAKESLGEIIKELEDLRIYLDRTNEVVYGTVGQAWTGGSANQFRDLVSEMINQKTLPNVQKTKQAFADMYDVVQADQKAEADLQEELNALRRS